MDLKRKNAVLEKVRRALGEEASPAAPRPPVLPPRKAGSLEAELDLLLNEINALSGVARRLKPGELETALEELVRSQAIKKAVLWETPGLAELGVAARLRALGVEMLSPGAGRHALAGCDLGVTEVDFALPETGTLGLLSSAEKPRAVSLLPRLHLAILRPQALRADLHQVFAEAREGGYLVLITGPSRTADIELTVALGVHGPQSLYVWALA